MRMWGKVLEMFGEERGGQERESWALIDARVVCSGLQIPGPSGMLRVMFGISALSDR